MRRVTDDDRIQVVRLLEALRGSEGPISIDVEAAVFGRLRGMERPRSWSPVLTLREFGLGAAAAIAAMVLAAAGLLSVTSPKWLSAPAAGLKGVFRILGTLAGALWDIAGAAARAVLDLAGPITERASYLDGSLMWVAQAALLVFGAMLALTVLVVFHEARGRRLAG